MSAHQHHRSTTPGRAPRPLWPCRRTTQLHSQVHAVLARVASEARRNLCCCSAGGADGCLSRPSASHHGGRPGAAPAVVKSPRTLLNSVADLTSPLGLTPLGLAPLPPSARAGRKAAAGSHVLTILTPVDDDDDDLDDGGGGPVDSRGRPSSFAAALRPALTAAQVFWVLPAHVGRRARLARTITLVTLISTVATMAFLHMFRIGMRLESSSPFVFYATAALSVYLLSSLSAKWSRLAARWRRSRSPLVEGGDDGTRDVRTCTAITAAMITLALVEHILSLLDGVIPLIDCSEGEEGGAWVVYKSYFLNKFPMVFDLVPFSTAASFVLLYINVTCTFLWNFIDILIIVISYLLSRRFKRFNAFLEKAKGKDYSVFWWQEARESFNRLSALTKYVDAHLNSIILLSFASNLYFICLQLLHNMTYEENGAFSRAYFYFSVALLVSRAALVSMSAASVYDQSLGPVNVLHCVPSRSFCVEVQRFLVQATTDTVALTGCRFFWVTRSLMLTLAGTIATYEIVLVQFHRTKTEDQDPVCFY